ncbi:lasso peptide biosynthesis B2 protein [Longimicrobium sp.]|uniref:lasso peptide biosynthesis B2 protein n=1 Tax=Longimicrobium sp. TaxID=2029185 RepID=UPI002C4F48B1|nr:lasso peptide biosynthesis B2 protein [Longimicrobium sp.]HSU12778.1 lasso peptide biosynthesis B2 protein [Longimicrobium sp.]
MIRTAGAVLAGARAALAAPRWIEGPRLTELLRPPARSRAETRVPRGATGSAMRLLRLLARVPGRRWRNTCLYRSVAECLVLRRYGIPAIVKIGVKSGEGDIEAHAWVVRADRERQDSGDGHEPLVLRA